MLHKNKNTWFVL